MASRRGIKSKSKHLVASLVTGKKAPCAFCQRNVDDEIIYGKLYAIGDIQCHYLCALLSCCLIQKGKDEDGLFGFLYVDILAEIERSKKHKCSYCLRGGANLGCSVGQCRKQFHLPCGRERDAVSLFSGNYKSFCQLHAPKQNIPEHIMAPARLRKQAKRRNLTHAKTLGSLSESDKQEPSKQESEAVCVICYEEVDAFPTPHTFWPPCCARDAWFHRTCLQRMALSAGMHYLKCPLCNDKERFHEALLTQGYYVPDRDAAWELEQNAFAGIYERALSCAAEECLCPMGRDHDADTGQWDIKLCILCGAVGMHAQCLDGAGAAGAGAGGARCVCATCRPAAPDDLERLAASIEAVILSEQAGQDARTVRHGPVMPSRMSLRRTKRGVPQNTPSTSRSSMPTTDAQDPSPPQKAGAPQDTPSSRLELNLGTPRLLPTSRPGDKPTHVDVNILKDIDNIMPSSPMKMLEHGLNEKIRDMGARETGLDTNKVLERVREKFQKPQPLCVKKRIMNNILENIFENMVIDTAKTKEPIKEWSTPKKYIELNVEVNEESMQENTEPTTETIESDLLDNDITKTPENKRKPLEITTESPNNNLESVVIADNTLVIALESPGIAKDSSKQELLTLETTDTNVIPAKDTEGNVKEETDKETCQEESNEIEDNSSNSTFELPSEFIADHHSDDSLTLFETPKKLKTVEIEKNSSLEISACDEIVNVDIFKMNSNDKADVTETLNIVSPVKSTKCAFKFSPLNKDTLKTNNLDIDVESFKSQYLNEVDKFKCAYEHKHKHKQGLSMPKNIRTAIDFAVEAYEKEKMNVYEENCLKRKFEAFDAVEEKRQKKDKCMLKFKNINIKTECSEDGSQNKESIDLSAAETDNGTKMRQNRRRSNKLSMRGIDLSVARKSRKNSSKLKKMSINQIDLTVNTTDGKKKLKQLKNKRHLQVKIRWKKEQLRLKITESKSKQRKQVKSNMKQYILNPETKSSDIVLMKPDNDVVLKRKYVKQEKSPDNLKQTSIQSFFKIKIPEKSSDK